MIIGFASLPHYCWHTHGEWCQIWICSLCFAMVFGGKMNVGRDEWWWTQTKTYLRPQVKVLRCLMKLGRCLEFDAFCAKHGMINDTTWFLYGFYWFCAFGSSDSIYKSSIRHGRFSFYVKVNKYPIILLTQVEILWYDEILCPKQLNKLRLSWDWNPKYLQENCLVAK
jgi:hypothetical protein